MEIGVLIWSWIGLATSSLPRLYTTTQKSRMSRHTKIGLTNVLYFRIRFEELRDSLASWSLARFDLFIRFASSGFMMHDVVLRYDTPGPRFWRRLGTSTRYPPPLFQYFHVRFRATFDPLGCAFIFISTFGLPDGLRFLRRSHISVYRFAFAFAFSFLYTLAVRFTGLHCISRSSIYGVAFGFCIWFLEFDSRICILIFCSDRIFSPP
jgi:hypothetical protein